MKENKNQKKNLFKTGEKKASMVTKGLGLCIGAAILIEQAGKILKEDNVFYKRTNKLLLNRLLEENSSIIRQSSKLHNLFLTPDETKAVEEEVGLLDEEKKEDISTSLNVESEIFVHFLWSYLQANEHDLYNLHMLLKNVAEGNRGYTKEEVTDMLKMMYAQLTSSVELPEDEYFNDICTLYEKQYE